MLLSKIRILVDIKMKKVCRNGLVRGRGSYHSHIFRFHDKQCLPGFRNQLNNEFINCCVWKYQFEKEKCCNCEKICKTAIAEKHLFCIWEIYNLRIYLWDLAMRLCITVLMRKSVKLLLFKNEVLNLLENKQICIFLLWLQIATFIGKSINCFLKILKCYIWGKYGILLFYK